MKIQNSKQYKDTLKALGEYEKLFNVENGTPCHILIPECHAGEMIPLVIIDTTIADRRYENGNYSARTKGIILGQLPETAE